MSASNGENRGNSKLKKWRMKMTVKKLVTVLTALAMLCTCVSPAYSMAPPECEDTDVVPILMKTISQGFSQRANGPGIAGTPVRFVELSGPVVANYEWSQLLPRWTGPTNVHRLSERDNLSVVISRRELDGFHAYRSELLDSTKVRACQIDIDFGQTAVPQHASFTYTVYWTKLETQTFQVAVMPMSSGFGVQSTKRH
jgi:hypothetical protein